MRPITLSRTLAAADPNGIALDQTTGGAGDLTLNGALVVDGVAQLTVQRQVELESAGNLSAVNFTVVGTDQQGRSISETIAGPNAAAVATELDFLTVTQVSVDVAVATNVEVGTNGAGGSQVIPLDQYISPLNTSFAVVINGTANVTAQFTLDDIFGSVGPFQWFSIAGLEAISATAESSLPSPARAVRLLTNGGTDNVTFTVVQAGLT